MDEHESDLDLIDMMLSMTSDEETKKTSPAAESENSQKVSLQLILDCVASNLPSAPSY